MATIAITTQERGHGYLRVTWEGLGDADEGAVYTPPDGYDLESIQFTGTFGSATATIQGSNEETPTNWADIEGTGLTAEGIIAPDFQTRHFRPQTSGGTGTDVDAHAFFRSRN